MEYAVYTNKGKLRDNNEDSYLIQAELLPLFAVADGMGGHQAGEVASRIAVEHLENTKFDPEKDLLDQIEDIIQDINLKIRELGNQKSDYNGMGTTLSMGIIYQHILYIGHVGDSRIYLFRNDELQQLTTDHSLVNHLVEQKKITSEEAFNHPQRNILTQALGTETNLEVEVKVTAIKDNDLILFCTDGLSDMIKFKDIETSLRNHSDINKLSNQLGKMALDNGGSDNITLIISKMG